MNRTYIKNYFKSLICIANEILEKNDKLVTLDEMFNKEVNKTRLSMQTKLVDKLLYFIESLMKEVKQFKTNNITPESFSQESSKSSMSIYKTFYETLVVDGEFTMFKNIFVHENKYEDKLFVEFSDYFKYKKLSNYGNYAINGEITYATETTKILYIAIKSMFRYMAIIFVGLMDNSVLKQSQFDTFILILNTSNQAKGIQCLNMDFSNI